MDFSRHNQKAWDRGEKGKEYTIAVDGETIAKAPSGNWKIYITPTRPVRGECFPSLKDFRVLCLAGAGGQQGPILAAAGAEVTVFDNFPGQLD